MSIQSNINQLIGMAGSLAGSISKKQEAALKQASKRPKTAPGATPQDTMKKVTTEPTKPVQGQNTKPTNGAGMNKRTQPMARTREAVLQETARKLQEGIKQRDGRRSFMDYVKSGEAGKDITSKFSKYERQKIMNKVDAERRAKDGKQS